MRSLYFLLFLLLFHQVLPAQSPAFAPVSAGRDIRRAALRETTLRQDGAGQPGFPALRPPGNGRGFGDCPPDFDGFLVESGQKIVLEVDTFGLGMDTSTPVLSILNAGALQFGSALLIPNTIDLEYTANPGLLTAGIDSVLVGFSQNTADTFVYVPIHVKRPGRTLLAPVQPVSADQQLTYCYGDFLDFPRPMACGEFLDCPDNYDGEGAQFYYFSSYDYPDSCLIYKASRFPGTDTVCIQLCDEWQVCDTILIPFLLQGDTISTLPFFDDFSSYQGPYSSAAYWLDKDVFVNSTLAKDPPSVGMATFDGLDFRGDPYAFSAGIGDRLTSKPIDLSGLTPFSNVVLRFFLAPKGYGLAPEKNDVFILEFRNNQRQWIVVDTFEGLDDIAITTFPPFQFYAFPVSQPQFLHKAFQFRFSSATSPGGEVDLWHLDYVYLDKQSSLNDFFGDFAFTSAHQTILKNYTAIPLHHFQADIDNEVLSEGDTLRFGVFNHFNDPRSFSDSRLAFLETSTNEAFDQNFTLADAGSSITEPKQHRQIARNIPPVMSAIKNSLAAIPAGDFRNLQSQLTFTPNASEDPIFKHNDTVRLNNVFSNYFSYDDGTAEWQFFIKSALGGEQMAIKYHANVDDTLRAVQFLFPHVNNNVQNQVFTLKVWAGSLDTEPVFERELLKPFYPNNVLDTLQGFTTYVLNDYSNNETPVFIPKGDFFVGLEQSSAAAYGIPVGYDLQHPCNCNYYNIVGSWELFPSNYPGALMIRPVFGKAQSTTNGVGEKPVAFQEIVVFPNPTHGHLSVQVPGGQAGNFQFFIYDAAGQLLESGSLNQQFSLSDRQAGLYFIQFVNEKTGEMQVHRVLKLGDSRP